MARQEGHVLRRRNQGRDAEASASVRVGTRRRAGDVALLDTSAAHPPLPPGWAMVWCLQGRPYYWNYSDGSAQWELPAGVQSGTPRARLQCDRTGEASLGNELDEGPHASSGLGSESSARPTLRIRFASAHGMAQQPGRRHGSQPGRMEIPVRHGRAADRRAPAHDGDTGTCRTGSLRHCRADAPGLTPGAVHRRAQSGARGREEAGRPPAPASDHVAASRAVRNRP